MTVGFYFRFIEKGCCTFKNGSCSLIWLVNSGENIECSFNSGEISCKTAVGKTAVRFRRKVLFTTNQIKINGKKF